eukprot:GILK01004305.1.p1 GENE.GILK01004305.1~~GILK01004305.1.p1  ORF type:complete len:498 (-),score=106.80 GILK01004305.1:23-1516(-)
MELVLLVVVALLSLLWFKGKSAPAPGLPPGPARLPILGNLLELGKSAHLDVQRLSKKYGNLLSLQLGQVLTIVISCPKIAKEAFGLKGSIYSSRPTPLIAGSILNAGGKDIAFAPYGDHWRKARKAVHQQVNIRAVDNFNDLIDLESKHCVEYLLKASEEAGEKGFHPRVVFKLFPANVIHSMLFGSRMEPTHPELLRMLAFNDTIFELAGAAHPVDYLPWMKIFPNAAIKRAQDASADRDDFLYERLNKIKQKLAENDSAAAVTFAAKLLEMQQDPETELSDEDIVYICSDVLLAGLDTTSTALEWLLLVLANNPQCIVKAQKELDAVTGGKRLPTLADQSKLPYIDALVQEIFRYKAPGPLGVPHLTTEDDNLCGYTIPKESQVILNIGAIHKDPALWTNPDQFNPDRFMNNPASDDLFKKDNRHNVLPFSLGRRICVGMHLAERELYFCVARMLYCMDIAVPDGKHIDEFENFGLTVQPNPFLVRLTRRQGISW